MLRLAEIIWHKILIWRKTPAVASFKDILNSEMPLLDNEIDDILESLEFIQSINLDTVNIDKADAMFFYKTL